MATEHTPDKDLGDPLWGRATGPSDLSPASGSSQSSVPIAGHTPGPWKAEPADMFGDVNITGPEDCRAIAAVVSNLRPSGQVIANAHLIAAAPDMLAVLIKLAADRRIALGMTNRKLIAEAITKASGEPQ